MEYKEEKQKAEGADLYKFQIFSSSYLKARGYKLAFSNNNRVPQKTALTKKKKSIGQFGVLAPCLIVSAAKCIKEGLEIVDENGKSVTEDTSGLNLYLVVIDGGHRVTAVAELNKNRNDDDKIECYFYLPFNDDVPVYELLRQSNIVTTPWSGSTYLSSLIMAKDEAAKNQMLTWVESMSGMSGDTAAWQWATLKRKVPTKTQLIKASGDDEKAKVAYSKISDTSNFEAGKSLYEAFRKHFKAAILGCKFFPEWVIERFDDLKDAKGKNAAVETLVKFAESFNRDTVDVIEGFKGADRGRLVKSKLSELYAGFAGTETLSKTDAE